MDTIKIANEVVAVIAALAAMEVDGVKSMADNITNEMIQKLSKKNLSKGVRVDVNEGRVSVVLMLNIDYNANIPKVSENVQNRVKNAIESTTDLCVLEVVVKVAGVSVA